VLSNLLENAVKYSPAGGDVEVTLRIDGLGVLVCVSDSGPGVSRELAERVFHDGYTTKRSRDGRPRGLGLALVHRLVSQLGGHIEVTVGPGATFTATLPVVAAQVAPDQPTVSSRTP